MDWILFGFVVAGWIVGFILLDKVYNWLLFRITWKFHVLDQNSYLKMNEGAQDRFYREDEYADRR